MHRSDPKGLLRRWFVEYNPLYFFSALCVLGGIFLISMEVAQMDSDRFATGRLLLFLVLQLYEAILLAGAALLHRQARQTRPAVILAIMSLLFLFDPTFRVESLADMGTVGLLATFGWTLLTGGKLYILFRIFRIRMNRLILASGMVAAVGLVGLSHLPVLGAESQTLVLYLLNWLGFMLTGVLIRVTPRLTSLVPLSAWGEQVLRRTGRAALAFGCGFYYYHLVNFLFFFTVADQWQIALQVSPFLLLALAMIRGERLLGLLSFFMLSLTVTLHDPLYSSFLLAMTGTILGWKAWRGAHPVMRFVALFFTYCAVRAVELQAGQLPSLGLTAWQNLLFGSLALLLLWWINRLVTGALVILGAAWAIDLPRLLKLLIPESSLSLGLLLLALGFVALVAGVVINWRLGQSTDLVDSPPPFPDVPPPLIE
ncbi:MAG: hypothetical protein HQL57_07785 [Magnetococcales bacterium]|nr:hypothetical protein [Magnetococcales bacterium]